MVAGGVLFLALGAILYWVAEVDLPWLDDAALAVVLMVAGLLLVAASALVTTEQAQAGVSAAIALMAAGAVVHWALELDLRHIDDGALGAILIAVGAIGAVAAVVAQVQQNRRLRAPVAAPGAGRVVR